MFLLKTLFANLGSQNLECRPVRSNLSYSKRSDYLFNSTITGIESADRILLVGTNPRLEAPVLNARLRKAFLAGAKIANIGTEFDLTYKYTQLGDNAKALEGAAVAKFFEGAKNPIVILGIGATTRADYAAIYAAASKLGTVNILHTQASTVGGLDVGFAPGKKAKFDGLKLVYLLGYDEFAEGAFDGAFVVYQGHHGDAGAKIADVILPGSAYTEKDATYVNLEGRVQRTQKAVFAPGEAKEDWKIIRALSEKLEQTIEANTLDDVRALLEKANPVFAKLDEVTPQETKPTTND